MRDVDRDARVSESADLGAADNTLFDASQYEFFGNNAVEEVELGGLEDDGDEAGLVGHDDNDNQLYSFRDREEADGLGSFSDIDDISSTLSKLDTTGSEARGTGVVGARRSFSREGCLPPVWARELIFPERFNQHSLAAETAHETKRWPSQLDPPSDFQPPYRTSSYPLQPHHQPNESILSDPRSSFTSYQPPGGLLVPAFTPPAHFAPGFPNARHYGGYPDVPSNFGQPNMNHWPSRAGPPIRSHQVHPQTYNPCPPMLGMPEFRDHRMMPLPRTRQNPRFSQDFDEPGWPQFRAKYMSAEEIESILRIQHAATHSNDPYVDDYYHEACLAKKSSRLKHRFFPSVVRIQTSRSRVNSEPHAYLHVDALGRIPFSSIKRPRPLLEVDPPSSDEIVNMKSLVKPLEQEPMLAARTIIEDGICLLLDVDDINRLLQFNPPEDGGALFRRRRQGLLEELASSLQLVDPLRLSISYEDDLLFLRVVSLPKGRKLLARYLSLLSPGDDSARILSMAVFRHLRFLFGELPADSDAAKTTANLVLSVSSSVGGMNLSALSACLVAIVCSSEQPPLRPIGSLSGDGASVITKSVLERATGLLTDPNATTNCSVRIRDLWQESFNAFFKLLTRYCMGKFESAVASKATPDLATAIRREMPVELLRASLPHTDESQRKVLLDFARRSMPVAAPAANGSSRG